MDLLIIIIFYQYQNVIVTARLQDKANVSNIHLGLVLLNHNLKTDFE